jgi:hypothetical protein
MQVVMKFERGWIACSVVVFGMAIVGVISEGPSEYLLAKGTQYFVRSLCTKVPLHSHKHLEGWLFLRCRENLPEQAAWVSARLITAQRRGDSSASKARGLYQEEARGLGLALDFILADHMWDMQSLTAMKYLSKASVVPDDSYWFGVFVCRLKVNPFPTVEFRSAYPKLIAFMFDSNFNKIALYL